jgi:putative heme iron utilization protein
MNQGSSADDLIEAVRRVWHEQFHGVLSTQSQKHEGYPFGSLLPLCLDSKGNPLVMISHLAQHTRNLQADPRCSLIMTQQEHADVLQWGRLTCLADAEAVSSKAAHERYFRYFPDGRRYNEELNFKLYRLKPKSFYYIAGFGSARWLDISRVLDTPELPSSSELEILYQLNAHDHHLLRGYLEHNKILLSSSIQAVGADPSGFDVRQGDGLMRIHFDNPVTDESGFLNLFSTS